MLLKKTISPPRQGYLNSHYAESFVEFGEPRLLPKSGASILVREIPGHPGHRDAMAVYPFLCCENWEALEDDLSSIDDLVSLSVVPDPFGKYDARLLRSLFPDFFVGDYKLAAIADLYTPYWEFVSKKRQKTANKALEKIKVEVVYDPTQFVDEFHQLYQCLVSRHSITGLRAFSKNSIEGMLNCPDMVYIRARFENQTIGVHTWMIKDDCAYAHLAAYDLELGYKLSAPSALYWSVFEYFLEQEVRWMFFGGSAAGSSSDTMSKLANFKNGWKSDMHPVFVCGRIFQPEVYAELSKSHPKANYFPLYRQGEFA